jgi:hypothetical protein
LLAWRRAGAVSCTLFNAALENAADDFEVDWSNSVGPAKGIYSGKDRVREYWASFVEAF